MVYYVTPPLPFTGFNEHFEYVPGANIMRNLMQYCGYWSLHPNCWLYEWLQQRIRTRKFSGDAEFRQWCSYPAWLEFHQKMPVSRMMVNREQMERWKSWLKTCEDEIREQCSGSRWASYYDPRKKPQ